MTEHWKNYKREGGKFTSEITDFESDHFIKGEKNKENKENVYFFKCNEFIKVGRSEKPEKRLSAIQTANPYLVENEFILLNSRITENTFHYFLYRSGKHHRGEWFIYNDFMKRFIKILRIYDESLFYIRVIEYMADDFIQRNKDHPWIKKLITQRKVCERIEDYIYNKF